jgi:exodeoxyribonuclease VII small subunit
MSEASVSLDFEQAFRELESIVEGMERGELTLEQSLRAFERGLALHRACQQALDQAEQRVETLTRQGDGSLEVRAFQADGG